MKNIIAALMAAVMMLGFTACTGDDSGSASPDALPGASATITATPQPSAAPTPSAMPSATPTATPEAQPPEETAGSESGGVTADAIWEAIYEEYGDTFPVTEPIPAESLKDITGIDPEKLESFVFQFPMMNVSASEFFVAECKEGQLEAVKEEVMAHQAALAEQWKQYLPEQLRLVESYVMETADNYVFFAVAENAEGAAEIFKGFFD